MAAGFPLDDTITEKPLKPQKNLINPQKLKIPLKKLSKNTKKNL
jgi:hypothetical protein